LVDIPTLLVLNKSDLVEPSVLDSLVKQVAHERSRQVIAISALNASSLQSLLEKAGSMLARDLAHVGEIQYLSRTAN
jgi:50S ribosomal subunit-associated GTPase HflX